MAKRLTLRQLGLNPRARGINPRTLGTNPRGRTAMKSEWPVGLFGHSIDRSGLVETQFEIVRRCEDGRYAVQYFSFLSGDPTNVGFINDADLTDVSKHRLYDNPQRWREAADRSSEARRQRHG